MLRLRLHARPSTLHSICYGIAFLETPRNIALEEEHLRVVSYSLELGIQSMHETRYLGRRGRLSMQREVIAADRRARTTMTLHASPI